MNPTDANATAIALNRFGLGARPDEAAPHDPKAWLLAQLERYEPRPPAWAAHPASATLVLSYVEQQRALRQADAGTEQGLRQQLRRTTLEHYRDAVNARVTSALLTPAPFAERLVHFWANHFAVSIDKPPLTALAGAFEAEAIRPFVMGRFEDLLLAVEQHPAMLYYLDQVRSIGPDSPAGRRAARVNPDRTRGLNENLAREILELHTLGVRSGYSQQDVTEFARALTGWSIGGLGGGVAGAQGQAHAARPEGPVPGSFAFLPALHEPGPRTVLGQRYEQPGEGQARALLRRLAVAPATAQHIATKLARHFAGDQPPAPLVDRLATEFMRSGGDLPSLYRTLINAPEAWEGQAKFKTPWEWSLSAMRGLGWRELQARLPVPQMLTQLGQPAWRPGSPAGYDDIAASWAAPDALMRRIELAQRFAAQAGPMVDARALGPMLLPGGLSAMTTETVARAESPATALALLLASPEFLRR